MELPDVINQARDAMTVKRVFGDPYEKDGVTMIPAAKVQGAVGGGAGQGPEEQGSGSGGGYAVNARPVGAYVVRDGELSWQPALDLNRVILGGQVVAIFALLVIGGVLRARRRA
ncbi:MAG: spore germination protein GerW family protein [Acidimicrobiia bacterium]